MKKYHKLFAALLLFPVGEISAKTVEVPYQWVEYCQLEGSNDPSCSDEIDTSKPVKFKEEELLPILHKVNFKYNQFRFAADKPKYGKMDRWTSTLGDRKIDFFYSASGDCDDFVLSKRKELLSLGIPNSMMYITLVKVNAYADEMHMILVVKNGRKYYVLDNIKKIEIVETVDSNYIGLFHMNPIDKKWYTIHSKTLR